MKSIDTARKQANKLLEEARKEYDKVEDTINEYNIKLRNASADMEKCTNECDLDGYNKAREEKTTAEGALEMYQAKEKRLEEEPLLSREEYEKLCDNVIEEYINYIADLKNKLYDLTNQFEDLAQDARDTIKTANETLHSLQYDVYRGYDLEYGNSGKTVKSQSEKKVGSRADWDVVSWASRAGESQIYKDMKKERES